MEKNNDVLGGFDAIFETLSPNENIKLKGVEVLEDPSNNDNDTIAFTSVDDEPDDDIIPGKEIEEDDKEKDVEKEPEAKVDNEDSVDVDDLEVEQVTAFFDAIAEQVGWTDVADDEKPNSIEKFVEYMKEAVEASSVPAYANDDIRALDEYVKAGGSIENYINNVSTEIDYDNIDLENEAIQKAVIYEFLAEKGFSETQIRRKIDKYEDADLLEDEANDAIEFLRESKAKSKKELLDNQKMAYEQSIQEQQTFYSNVVQEIEALTDVRGIKIPPKDKQQLMEYIFKVENDGKTRYQKEYSKSNKNLIESAYFTMKGDALIDQAKRSGETSAVERLRKTLTSNKVSGSKQTINNGSPAPLWSIASEQLLRRPQ